MPTFRNWQTVQREVLRRIHSHEWMPGELIPSEAELALEFGCARATVNRALQAVADSGLLDRRRKAGTRVALEPIARATLAIPVIRTEVEGQGMPYSYRRLLCDLLVPPVDTSTAMDLQTEDAHLFVSAMHFANNAPYALETRWINAAVVPHALHEPFDEISANEWLLANAPYSRGDIAFSASQATAEEANLLGCNEGSALFTVDRLTWHHENSVTKVRLLFAAGYQMRTNL